MNDGIFIGVIIVSTIVMIVAGCLNKREND